MSITLINSSRNRRKIQFSTTFDNSYINYENRVHYSTYHQNIISHYNRNTEASLPEFDTRKRIKDFNINKSYDVYHTLYNNTSNYNMIRNISGNKRVRLAVLPDSKIAKYKLTPIKERKYLTYKKHLSRQKSAYTTGSSARFNKIYDANGGKAVLPTNIMATKSTIKINEKNEIETPQATSDNVFKRLLHNAGLFSRNQINKARYTKFSRNGYIDPYNTLFGNNMKEYLFFVRPDLNILEKGGSGKLNPQLENNAFFKELNERYIDVCYQLQYSATTNPSKNYFANLLSFSVNSSLDLPGITSSNIDTPATIFGNNYEYRGSGEASDDNPKFSLEFKDTKYLETYMFFRAYEEYEQLKRHGLVSPRESYIFNKILHDQMGVYKFITDDTGMIVYYAYIWGVKPDNVPREAFSNISNFDNGITYSIDFSGAFVEDMNPLILRDFNRLMKANIAGSNIMPLSSYTNMSKARISASINQGTILANSKASSPQRFGYSEFATGAYVAKVNSEDLTVDGKSFYRLIWVN